MLTFWTTFELSCVKSKHFSKIWQICLNLACQTALDWSRKLCSKFWNKSCSEHRHLPKFPELISPNVVFMYGMISHLWLLFLIWIWICSCTVSIKDRWTTPLLPWNSPVGLLRGTAYLLVYSICVFSVQRRRSNLFFLICKSFASTKTI